MPNENQRHQPDQDGVCRNPLCWKCYMVDQTDIQPIPKEQSADQFDEMARKLIEEGVGVNDPEGSYIYHLIRVKEAFSVGTMSLDDFTEIESGDEWVEEVIGKVAQTLRTTAQTEYDRGYRDGFKNAQPE